MTLHFRTVFKVFFISIFLFSMCFASSSITTTPSLNLTSINRSLDIALVHAKNMSEELKKMKGALPRSIDAQGKLVTSDAAWWTSGFYPGELWYLYEYSKDREVLKLAQQYTQLLEAQQYATDNHDIGFMLYCSYGNGFRLTGDKQYKELIQTGSNSLMKRYNPKVGLIRSWDIRPEIWQYPVIIDNMMNLEMLFWASKQTNNPEMYKKTVSHAVKTMENHFRPDYSCYHVVSYDTLSGLAHRKQTAQGLNDSSSWARGQGWALYGFTMVYRFTKEKRFLEQALHVADYILSHPSIPSDKVPLWDFNAGKGALRDASAAALMASALIELSEYAPAQRARFLEFAKQQLISLSSDKYFANPNTNGNFVLKHSVGNMPKNYEIDTPLSYADYYYVEALLRYRKLLMKH